MYRVLQTLVALVAVAVAAGCAKAPTPARLEVSPRGGLLTPSAPTRKLQAKVFDSAGKLVQAPVTWTSSAPDAIEVDRAGVVKALKPKGSAVITAEAGGFRAVALLVAVEPAPGAVVVHDDNVVGAPVPVSATAPLDVGYRYQVTLTGVEAPPVGALLYSDGEKPVGGRVVAVGGEVVTLELVPLDELLPDLDVAVRLDLAAGAVIPEAVTAVFDAERLSDGRTRFVVRDDSGQNSQGLGVKRQGVGEGPFSCETTLPGVELELANVAFTVHPSFTYDFVWNRQQQKLVVEGQPSLDVEATPKLSAAIEGKLTCKLIVFDLPIPAPGPLGLFIGAFLPMGIGFEVGGKVPIAEVGAELKGTVTNDYRFGFDCNPNCVAVKHLDFDATGDAKPVWPSVPDAKLELGGYGFVFARLEGGARFSSTLRFEAIEAKAGLKLEGTFSTETFQLNDPDFKGAYGFSFEASVGAARDFDRFLRLLRVTVAGLELKYTRPISKSPVGEARASRRDFQVGDTVTFDVTLAPDSLDFVRVGYNVQAVRIVRRSTGSWLLVAEVPGVASRASYSLSWVATEAGSIGHDFFALVETKLLSSPRLELAEVTATTPQAASYSFQQSEVYLDELDAGTRYRLNRTEEHQSTTLALQLVSSNATTKQFDVVGGSVQYTYKYDFIEKKWDAGYGNCHYNDTYEQHDSAQGSAPITGQLRLYVSDAGQYVIDGAETDFTATGTGTTEYRVEFTGSDQTCRTPFTSPNTVSRNKSTTLKGTGTGASITAPTISGTKTEVIGNKTTTKTWTLTMP